MTQSLRSTPRGGQIARVLSAGLQAVEPGAAVRHFMRREGHQLIIGDRGYDLNQFQRVLIVGTGKAGTPMTQAAVDILGERLYAGLVIVKEGYTSGALKIGAVSIAEAGHPIPDQRGLQASKHLIELLEGTKADDFVICLISGGGSALMTSPVDDIGLQEMQALTQSLLASGADINEINTMRKHLEQLKGGKLARLAAPSQLATLILSDVVGDALTTIASGPTVPDPTTFEDAFKVLERYNLTQQIPSAVVAYLQRGIQSAEQETPKPDDPLFDRVQNVVIGSNKQAADAAVLQAQREGFNASLLTTYLQGEARYAGRFLGAIARQIVQSDQPIPKPACLVIGGETTVTLQGNGMGGRNQEMALSAVQDLAGLPDVVLISMASDGGDGPTDAAGAVVTGKTLKRARNAGLNPSGYLEANDSYHFFNALGDLLKIGPTQTNVNDLAFIFAF